MSNRCQQRHTHDLTELHDKRKLNVTSKKKKTKTDSLIGTGN